MSAFSGFCSFKFDFSNEKSKWNMVLTDMNNALNKRGGVLNNICLQSHFGITMSSEIDLNRRNYFFGFAINEQNYLIALDGVIYNEDTIKLCNETTEEAILRGIEKSGIEYINTLDGSFAGVVFNETTQTLYVFRDHLGLKPLFYTIQEGIFIFASEIKALFNFPGVKAICDKNSLSQIFGLGPARKKESGVFKNIYSVCPGSYGVFNISGYKEKKYWQLVCKPHVDTYDQSCEMVRFLLEDTVNMQMKPFSNVGSLLSGGVDSSLVTAIAANQLKLNNKELKTFSFDFIGNDIYFKSSAFQPELDKPYVKKMVEYCNTNHHYLECDSNALIAELKNAVIARDLPGMADVDSSLLYFCKEVRNEIPIVFTGECSDEIFAGYPWFHKEHLMNATLFPWSSDIAARTVLLSDDVINNLDLDAYVSSVIEGELLKVPKLGNENAFENRMREISYLTLEWFMATLVDRLDRMSASAQLQALAPFANKRLVEYLWNVPFDIKCHNGEVKSLLRDAFKGYIPDDVLYRKKSPYPKTYNPSYDDLLKKEIEALLLNKNSPILQFIDEKKVRKFLNAPSNTAKPWYGQLMAGPQVLAYLLQVNFWLTYYKIQII